MKELTIEQKAKRYDEALKRAKITLDCCGSTSIITKNTIYDIFFELQESEDERIRKELIAFLKTYDAFITSRYISWLEKQGEQKSNPCDGCVNHKGCIDCENGELRETEQKPAWNEEDQNALEDVREAVVHYWGGDTQDILCIGSNPLNKE